MLCVINLYLILFRTSLGIYSITKYSTYTLSFLSITNEIQNVSLLCLPATFVTYAPSFTLGNISYEKSPLKLGS